MRWMLVLLFCVACGSSTISDGGLADAGALDAAITDAESFDAGRDGGPPDGGPPADLDGFIEWQMGYGHLPGLAIAVIRGGEVVWIGTYGLADRSMRTPVDEHTLFPVASISKTFVLARALQLVEAGMLDLDVPADTITPYAVRHPSFPAVPISSRMLLCHVSGIVDQNLELAAASFSGDPPITLEQFARGYLFEDGAYYSAANYGERPGTVSSYCNACLGIMGHVVELAGDQGFRDQTRIHLFEPLALDGAGWFIADVDPAHLAVPYGFAGRSYYVHALQGFGFYPATTLRISVTGLSRWARMWMRGGELDGVRVLEQATVDAALTIQYPDLDRGQALTFYRKRIGSRTYMGHGGSTFGGSAQLLFDVESQRGLILMANSDAYIRQMLGFNEGSEAIDAILERVDSQDTFE